MGFWTRRYVSVRSRLASLNRTQRIAGVLLATAVAGGAIYLAISLQPLPPVAVFTAAQGDVQAAASQLQAHNVPAQLRDGELLVAAADAPRARAALANEGLLDRDADLFGQSSDNGDIWRTQEQNDKRWQAAKMATLARQIGLFPPIRQASVILEPGTAAGLGRKGSAPTAAVNVTLKDGAKMTPRLVEAIADTVAGSVAGMNRQDVRIIDSAGASYRAREESAAASMDEIDRMRLAEAYYTDKARTALGYVEGLVIGVNVTGDAKEPRCLGASISVPRSYLASIAAAGNADDEQIDKIAPHHLAKIQQAAAKALGTPTADDVKVDWYYDAPATAAASPRRSLAGLDIDTWTLSGVLCVLIVLVALNFAWRRLAASRKTRPVAKANAVALDAGKAAADSVEGEHSLSLLEHMDTDSLIDFVHGEHPQTIAILLAHLSATKAAAVLGGLEDSTQVEVSRRLASLDKIDPQLLAQVETALAGRLADSPPADRAKLGGPSAVAQILHHAGYEAGRVLLGRLDDAEPALADSIRRRMFRFEELHTVPGYRLRAALDEFDSQEMAIALCAAAEGVRQKVLASLSSDASEHIREQMADMGPLRLSDVEMAQEAVVEALRRFEEGQYIAERSLAKARPLNEVLA